MNHFLPFLTPSAMQGGGIQQQYMPANLSQYINPNADMKAKLAINAHISKNLGPHPWDTYKTVMCQTWLETADCRFGQNCRFAHGEEELRHVHAKPRLADNPRYKTRPCEKFVKKGICPYGPRCLFIHPDLSSNMSPGLLLPLDDQGRASPGQNMPFSANVLAPISNAQFAMWTKAKSTEPMPKVFIPISSIWSSDEYDGSGTTSTSRGSPPDSQKAFSSSANECKPEQEDLGKRAFNDSAGCLTELRDKLADGLLLDTSGQ